ncbi:MAG: NAD(+) synthase [Clostridia bacterium]|nr:NAD(+) synthase [Clostridia bacterium]
MSASMMHDAMGMVRVMAASPRVHLGNPKKNAEEISALLDIADQNGVCVCVFPELSLSGSTCGDLFFQDTLLGSTLEALKILIGRPTKTAFVVGAPLAIGAKLYNCAIVISGGQAVVIPDQACPKDRSRWFCADVPSLCSVQIPGIAPENVRIARDPVIDFGRFTLGVEIGERFLAPAAPGSAMITANLCACAELAGSHTLRTHTLSAHSARCLSSLIYAGAGFGESTTDMVFSGYAGIYECGECLSENARFARESSYAIADIDVQRLAFKRRAHYAFASSPCEGGTLSLAACAPSCCGKLLRPLSALPFLPAKEDQEAYLLDALRIQANSLIRRMEHIRTRRLVVGVSGGLDSTLALLSAAYAYDLAGWDKQGIVGITMPGFGTGTRTKGNADNLMELIGCTTLTIPIGAAVTQHFDDIGQSMDVHDVCYENSQARERTQIIMDYANKIGALALGTGDLSELTLGWCTYNGDHMSMYNLNGSIPKTLMRSMVACAAGILGERIVPVVQDILDTPVSPELIPGENGEIVQKTEETLGAYELHDFFLWHMMDAGAGPKKLYAMACQTFAPVHAPEEILRALRIFVRRFFTQQFKRSAMPDGPQVTPVSLSPRGSWHMPSDAQMQLWLDEVDDITP